MSLKKYINNLLHRQPKTIDRPLTVEELSTMQSRMVFLVSQRFSALNGWFYISTIHVDRFTGRLTFVMDSVDDSVTLDELDFSVACDVVKAYRYRPEHGSFWSCVK